MPEMRITTKFDTEIIDRHIQARHPPFFIAFVSIFELCVFVYYASRAEEPLTLLGPIPFKSKLIYSPYRRYEIWRFLTYAFIHAGYWHISFNLLVQIGVGVPLELVHKFNPLFIIYFGGVIGGALGNSIADPHSYLAGASGGCYALIAAHLSNLIINWKEVRGGCMKLSTLLLFCLADFGAAVYERHHTAEGFTYRTSYGGHLAGALSGFLLGIVYLRNFRVRNWEQVVRRFAGGLFVTLVVSNHLIYYIRFNLFCVVSR